jgi:hypothetical protein
MTTTNKDIIKKYEMDILSMYNRGELFTKEVINREKEIAIKQIFKEFDKITPNYKEQGGTTYTYEGQEYRTIQQVIFDIKKKYKVD